MMKCIQASTKAFVLSIAAILCLSLFDSIASETGFGGGFIASAEAQEKKRTKTRRLPGISERVFKQLGEASEYLSPPEDSALEPDFKKALAELQSLEKKCKKCNKYELAQIYRLMAFSHFSLNDYDSAISYYDKVVAQSPDIPIAVELNALYALSQLTFSQAKYDRSLAYLKQWMKLSTDVGADIYYLLATIEYQKGDKKRSLFDVSKAIKMTEERGKVAKEPWYNLQKVLYIEGEDYKSASEVLQKLILSYSKADYWMQLSGVYGYLGQERNQLHALEAARLMGALEKRQHYINLASLYLNEGAPYKAAQVMEAGLKTNIIEPESKNLEILATAWSQAKETEKAIEVLTAASAKSENGELYARLLNLYLDIDDKQSAVDAGNKALEAGGLRRPSDVYTNLGVAYTQLKNYKAAIRAFDEAMKDERNRGFAANWKRFAESELSREQQLKAAL